MDNRKKTTLPEEILLFQILPKLPAKSLLRFKCVCKQWRSFLRTPMFIKIHLHHVTTVDHHRHEKLFFFNNNISKTSLNFQTIGCEDGLISTPRCHPLTGTVARPMTSCVNGLACLGIYDDDNGLTDMTLWNPLTGEYKMMSRPVERNCYGGSAITNELHYTCSYDDYKILRVIHDWSVYIYSLKSDSWRKLDQSTVDSPETIPYAGDHNFLDEKIHYIQRRDSRFIIIRLDLKTEKLTKIVVPFAPSSLNERLSFMVVRGCIELTMFIPDLFGTWRIEECRMDGDGNWTKVVKSIYSTQMSTSFVCPLYIMRNGNWIVHTRDGVCKLDTEKNTKDILFSYPNNKVIFAPGIYMIETLVSPNQYIH